MQPSTYSTHLTVWLLLQNRDLIWLYQQNVGTQSLLNLYLELCAKHALISTNPVINNHIQSRETRRSLQCDAPGASLSLSSCFSCWFCFLLSQFVLIDFFLYHSSFPKVSRHLMPCTLCVFFFKSLSMRFSHCVAPGEGEFIALFIEPFAPAGIQWGAPSIAEGVLTNETIFLR